MKELTDLNFILPRKGPSGDYHYVLLANPNTAVEWLRANGRVQDELYARFKDRVIDIGAYGDIEAAHALWAQQKAKEAEEAKKNNDEPAPTKKSKPRKSQSDKGQK